MNNILGGGVAAFCMCGGTANCLAGGVFSAGAFFFSGGVVEDLSNRLAEKTGLDLESSYFMAAQKTLSVALKTGLVYVAGNTAASALLGMVAFPLPLAGAFFAAVAHEVCAVAHEKFQS